MWFPRSSLEAGTALLTGCVRHGGGSSPASNNGIRLVSARPAVDSGGNLSFVVGRLNHFLTRQRVFNLVQGGWAGTPPRNPLRFERMNTAGNAVSFPGRSLSVGRHSLIGIYLASAPGLRVGRAGGLISDAARSILLRYRRDRHGRGRLSDDYSTVHVPRSRWRAVGFGSAARFSEGARWENLEALFCFHGFGIALGQAIIFF